MRNLPTITKYLLLTNLLVFLLDSVLRKQGVELTSLCGLHYISAPTFGWWQPFTYMFMHANFGHLFCNMFAVLFFGPILEQEWGERRYLLYYIVCGLGAAIVQELVWTWRIDTLLQTYEATSVMLNYTSHLNTIGASGAVFGILFAFGWLFPDVPLFILFIPIPIPARVMVIVYALLELGAGLVNISGDNVAHFAHLGGLIFGWLLLLWWRIPKGNDWHWPDWAKPSRWFHRHERLNSQNRDWHYHKRI